ncbi:hypothetical protein ACQFYA_02365 [Promicromonospora sp. Marseille-Q5078]
MSSRPNAPERAPRRRWPAVAGAAVLALCLGPAPALADGPVAASPAPVTAAPAVPATDVATLPLPAGLGKQMSSSSTLEHFLAWARAYGFRISGHPKYGGVKSGTHAAGSWHYDGLAADLNWGPAGAPASERARVKYAIKVADSMGIGVIYARDGTVGSAAHHRDHLHVDAGSTSNYGRGLVSVSAGQRKTQRLQAATHFAVRDRDNLWGSNTDQRLQAVRAASRMHGGKFPYGVKVAQRAVGVTADGKWGPKSRAAHDKTVASIQRTLGVRADSVWGAGTERTYLALRKKLR